MGRVPASLRIPRLALATALLFAWAALPSGAARADATDDAVAELAALEKAGDAGKCVERMNALKGSDDPRVAGACRDLARSRDDRIACAAIRLAAERKDPKLLDWLKARIGDKDLYREKDGRPAVYLAVLDAAAGYRDASLLKALADVERTFLTTNEDYSVRAIRAYGSVPQRAVVDQLVDWLGLLEQQHGGKSSGGSGGKSRYSPETQKIRDASRQALLTTLVDLTDEDQCDPAGWAEWWSAHGRTFEFPKPGPAVDVTTLAEWTDRRFGFRLTRPEGAGWGFRPGDKWFRIQIVRADEHDYLWGTVGWGVYSTANQSIKDVAGYADWWRREQFPQKDFEQFTPGGEPALSTKRFAGTDWTVVTAKGQTKGLLVSWGVVERRVYIAKLDDRRFIYAVGHVRTTARPEDQEKTWQVVERLVFTPK